MQPQQNDLLCRVENDAPMGRLMRQHWMPACMIEEVEEAGGTPRRIRLLGTNMVVFRDSKGRVGALDELCPHRRASLVFGRNEEECIGRRMKQLQSFVDRVCQHPVLAQSEVWGHFLFSEVMNFSRSPRLN